MNRLLSDRLMTLPSTCRAASDRETSGPCGPCGPSVCTGTGVGVSVPEGVGDPDGDAPVPVPDAVGVAVAVAVGEACGVGVVSPPNTPAKPPLGAPLPAAVTVSSPPGAPLGAPVPLPVWRVGFPPDGVYSVLHAPAPNSVTMAITSQTRTVRRRMALTYTAV